MNQKTPKLAHILAHEKILLFQQLLESTGVQVVMGGGNFISANIVIKIHKVSN